MIVAAYCNAFNYENIDFNTQIEIINDYCKNKGYNIVKIYTDDRIINRNLNSPVLTNLMNELELYKIEAIISVNKSTISSMEKVFNKFVKYFREKRVHVYCTDKSYPDFEIMKIKKIKKYIRTLEKSVIKLHKLVEEAENELIW